MKKHKTSDYIEFDRAFNVATKLIRNQDVLGLYIMIAINTGLRIGDMLALKFEHFQTESLIVIEGKTGKRRVIHINENIKQSLKRFAPKEGFLFKSQKNTVYRRQSINRRLKEVFKKETKSLNISSHSLRKSMGRKVYEVNGKSENSLVYLSEIFNHSSPAITRRYLGIRQEELNDIYMNL